MQNNYYFLYYFFDNPLIRWIRVLLFFLVGIIVYLKLHDGGFVIRILPLYFVLILQELFIHFKLENGSPSKTVSDDVAHPIECVEFKMRAHLERHTEMEKVIHELLHEETIAYFNKLINLSYKPQDVTILEEDVLRKASDLVAAMKGKYIHTLDIYVAYLLLVDAQNKMLFKADITSDDVIYLLAWVRKKSMTDGKKHKELRFTGSGVFDFFIYGWSAQLAKYASNFTREVLMNNYSEPIGRDREYDLLITALSKNSASNAMLVGGAGVGKTTLISKFVIDSEMGLLPKSISNKIVFKLFPERFLAGVNTEGALEERFVELFSELAHAGNIIVYIPNIENIFGGGGMNVDISGALVEYLRSSRIKIIGSTTSDAYQKYIYPKQEIKELFDTIDVAEPDTDTSIFMLLEKANELQKGSKISISYSAIKESCALSDSYINDGTAMPGRAIRLLEDVISYGATHGVANITKKEVQEFIQEKTHIVLDKPTEEESQKLLNLEKEIHKRIISQDEAVKAISDAMRRVRSGMKDEKKPIASFLFLGPTGVGKTETAKALAQTYFGDEKAMLRLDMSEYQSPDSVDRFLGSKTGQYQETIVDKIQKNPFTLVLLDEFEKAYPHILDLFLQILDDGRLTDNMGRTVSFNNTIIIATSNAGSEYIREAYKDGVDAESLKKDLVEKVLEANVFKPELVNRFDDVIVFKPLAENDAIEVARLFLHEVTDKIAEKQILVSYDDQVPVFIAANSYSVEFGARNIQRFIEQTVENQLSKLILSDDLKNGGSARIEIENNSLVIKT